MQAISAYEQDRAQALVKVTACYLERIVASNNRITRDTALTKFHALRPPGIPLTDYLLRILKYASCSAECFLLALIYMDRMVERNEGFALNSLNIHRMLITSVMLAAKYFDDAYFNNAFYARVGGVPCKELNTLELEFLFFLNFQLNITEDLFNRYRNKVATHALVLVNPCRYCEVHVDTMLMDAYVEGESSNRRNVSESKMAYD